MEQSVSAKFVKYHAISGVAKRDCEAVIRKLWDQLTSLKAVGVVGPDGFEVATISNCPLEVSKLAALSSTLIAVAEAFMAESRMASCRSVILDSKEGITLLFSVPVGDATYGLFVIATDPSLLGGILWRSRLCAAEVGKVLKAPRIALSTTMGD